MYVDASSSLTEKKALEMMALYFKREFRYDHSQYEASDPGDDCLGFLVLERAKDLVKDTGHHPNRAIGGGCFRKGMGDKWKLDWIWLHPFARNRGNLKKIWPGFKTKFDDFALQEPLSAQMKAFLTKYP